MGKKDKDKRIEMKDDELDQELMRMLLHPKTGIKLIESEIIKEYVERLQKLDRVGDCITFAEVVAARQDGQIKKNMNFYLEGESELLKFLSIGSPKYMAKEGIVLLGSSLTYPQQFKVREYHPGSPAYAEDNEYFYPECSLVIELYVDEDGVKEGEVMWDYFGRSFPRNCYIPKAERKDFYGTWDECMDHYVGLVERMMRLGADVLEKKPMRKNF